MAISFTPAADWYSRHLPARRPTMLNREAVAALVALGYKPQEASRMVTNSLALTPAVKH